MNLTSSDPAGGKKFTFATLATVTALATALLFQTSITQADGQGQRGHDHGQRGDDHERGDRDRDHRDHRDRDAKITFTKFVTAVVNQPGLIATMTGVGEGDAGDVLFTGDVLKQSPLPPAGVVAVYNFTGSKHSFTALIHVVETADSQGVLTAVILGVVTDGWLKGHAVEGEFTVIKCDHFGLISPNTTDCFEGSLEIKRDSKD